jgi:Fibronectin type III domain
MTLVDMLHGLGMRHEAIRVHSNHYRPSLELLEGRLCPSHVLATPTLLGLSAAGGAQVKLSWSSVPSADGYRVLEWTGTQTITVASAPADATAATVGNLPTGPKVWLSVEAFRGPAFADSAWQSIVLPTPRLTAVTGLTATAVSTSEIDLSWTGVPGATGYRIKEWDGTQAQTLATLTPGQHAYAVTGLAAGTTHFFSVEAFNSVDSVPTNWLAAKTLAEPIGVPGHLTLIPSGTKVNVTWTAATGATGYRVYLWDGAQTQLVEQTDGNTTQLLVKHLNGSAVYWFYVEAYNGSNSASTAWKRVMTTATAPPLLAPANVTAHQVASGQVELDWNGVARATGYMVYHWNGTNWEVLRALPGTARTARLTGLPAGRSQWFLVLAYTDGFVESAASAVIGCTP